MEVQLSPEEVDPPQQRSEKEDRISIRRRSVANEAEHKHESRRADRDDVEENTIYGGEALERALELDTANISYARGSPSFT